MLDTWPDAVCLKNAALAGFSPEDASDISTESFPVCSQSFATERVYTV